MMTSRTWSLSLTLGCRLDRVVTLNAFSLSPEGAVKEARNPSKGEDDEETFV